MLGIYQIHPRFQTTSATNIIQQQHPHGMADIAPPQPQALFKKRTAKTTARKRPATPPADSPSSSDSGYTSSENDSGQRTKRRKKSALLTASSKPSSSNPTATESSTLTTTTSYTADRSTALTSTNDATKSSNWFDEKDSSHLLGSSKNKKPSTTSSSTTAASTSEKAKTVGPTKAPTNVRTITVTDFAPDVCKDYKTTGFCGYGDSCKFLHARENYKQGWQLDRDWEIGSKNKPKAGEEELDEEEKILKDIPFKCVICKGDYKRPIVTKCGHYFCESCALGRYKRQPSCAICAAGTGGVFNGAKQLARLLEKKKVREKEAREKKRKEGEEVDSPDEEAGA